MEVLAQTISYGHEYTVYSNDGVGQPYKVVRRNLRNGTEQTAFFANQELIDNLDDDDLDELLKCCEDRIFLSVLFKKHRANQKAIRNLFATATAKTSHNVCNRPQTNPQE
ncbi:MAG: hypothetical protein IJ640_08475 [Prevotella sp.]|nr:hypothetical protein [Prevotella sp.]